MFCRAVGNRSSVSKLLHTHMHLEDKLCTKLIQKLFRSLDSRRIWSWKCTAAQPENVRITKSVLLLRCTFSWLLYSYTERHIVSKHLLTLVHRLFNYWSVRFPSSPVSCVPYALYLEFCANLRRGGICIVSICLLCLVQRLWVWPYGRNLRKKLDANLNQTKT